MKIHCLHIIAIKSPSFVACNKRKGFNSTDTHTNTHICARSHVQVYVCMYVYLNNVTFKNTGCACIKETNQTLIQLKPFYVHSPHPHTKNEIEQIDKHTHKHAQIFFMQTNIHKLKNYILLR